MIVKLEIDPEEFEFWGGAKARMDNSTEEQRQLVYARIEDMSADEFPTVGEVNDFVWLRCNDIFYPDKDDEE